MVHLGYFSTILFALPVVLGQRVVQWTVANGRLAPNGLERDMVLVNGQFPGPTLSFTKGDNIQVNVTNKLTLSNMLKSTTIHWHGIFQNRHPQDDGPAFVTQCPISRDHSYLYGLTTGDQAGTFWYHSHLSSQYLDGLRGPLIIHPEDPHLWMYDVDDDEHVIFLADYFDSPGQDLLHNYITTGIDQQPTTGSINGWAGVDGNQNNRPVFKVTKGKRYRFRIINGSAIAKFQFQIEGHGFYVIEADGENQQLVTTTTLNIWPGQRYSIVLEANQDPRNYWMRAPYFGNNNQVQPNTNKINAILNYEGVPIADPTTPLPAMGTPMLDNILVPVIECDPPANTTWMKIDIGRDPQNRFTVGGSPYLAPDVPTLLQILAHNKTAWTSSEATAVVERGQVVDLVITGTSNHPIHMHGHSFWVIQGTNDKAPRKGETVRRDTTSGAGTLILRFRADNPGPWFLHCHIDLHLAAGFAYLIAEDVQAQQDEVKPSAQWKELCNVYNSLSPDDK